MRPFVSVTKARRHAAGQGLGDMARQAVKTATKKSSTRSGGASPAKGKATKQTAKTASPKGKSTKTAPPRSTPPKTIAKSTPRKGSAAPTDGAKSVKAAKQATAGKRTRTARSAASGGGADNPLKQRFADLQAATREIAGMKRSITKHFFDVGVILNQIRDKRLYEVKGYGSFESFVERELDLNKVVCMRSARIAQALDREQAMEAGLDRSAAAVAALDGELVSPSVTGPASAAGVPLVPLHKQ